MSIEPIGPRSVAWVSPRGASLAGGGFSVGAGPEAAHTAPSAPAGLGMLSLQEIEDEPPRDKAARRHGRAVLTALTALQRRLLGTAGGVAPLDELARLVADVPAAADPGLAGALDAVLLRARIELARYGR